MIITAGFYSWLSLFHPCVKEQRNPSDPLGSKDHSNLISYEWATRGRQAMFPMPGSSAPGTAALTMFSVTQAPETL